MALDEQTVLTFRRDIYGKGGATKADLARLLAAGRAADAISPGFVDLLGEVATDVLVNDVEPPKHIQQTDADWFVDLLSKNGGLANRAEYDMLTRVIRNAVSVPWGLATFAVAQIERAIIAGAARHPSGVVTQAALDALRTVVYAATEGSSLHVTRDSAEALFRMADALADSADPAFDELFAQAIGNYVMGVAFRWRSSAGERKQADRWLDSPAPSLGEFMSSSLDFNRLTDDGLTDAFDNQSEEAELASAEKIDASEAAWLIARLNRDGKISAAEKRLLRFIRDESPAIDPALAALIAKAA